MGLGWHNFYYARKSLLKNSICTNHNHSLSKAKSIGSLICDVDDMPVDSVKWLLDTY